MPWQAEQQALLVEVLTLAADRLQERGTADAQVQVAAADGALCAHAMTTTEGVAWGDGSAHRGIVVAMGTIARRVHLRILGGGVLIRALCSRQSITRRVDAPMREVTQ